MMYVMVKFKDIIKEFSHLRFVADHLVFCTSLGRERLLNSTLITKREPLEAEYGKIEGLKDKELREVKTILTQFRDIRGTIDSLASHHLLNEIDLFELKYFAYHVNLLYKQNIIEIEQLIDLFTILDPNNSGVVNFYIYDTYDSELALLRKKEQNEENYLAICRREEVVREHLSTELHPFAERLKRIIDRVAEIDLLIAKNDFHMKNNLIKPIISDSYETIRYKGIFNLYLMSIVENYQKIDINLTPSPTLITGANMSGKTMLLKTVAMAQYMVQFGFYAPAAYCELSLVDAIFLSIGDSQKEEEGLSSYAAEILKVSHIIDKIDSNEKYLVLLDELARTTSPREGAAIVDAVTSLLKERGVMSLITTHYSSLQAGARCLRVNGFTEERIEGKLTKENISQFIDYTLTEVSSTEEQHSEAIRIAEILGVNNKLINKTKEFICTKRAN